jgi:hypothetical protein
MQTTVRQRPKERFNPADARDELNLAEFPITFLGDRVPDGQDTLEFQDTIRDPHTQKPVQRKLTITASTKYGLPTAKDDEVIVGLIQLTKLTNNLTKRDVSFSRYELIHLLGWPDTGQSYARVEESLNRWMTVTLFYDRAWWDNEAKSWVDEKFHILDHVSLYENERHPARNQAQRPLPFSTFTWGKTIFESFRTGYLKRLDLDFYLGLTYPTAKRIYRFLDKRFYHGPRWEFDLREFAFEHVGLSRSYKKAAEIRRKLAPAVKELEQKGLLEPLAESDRYQQVRRGEWRVIFLKKSAPALENKPAKGAVHHLEKELIGRGVTARTAAELVVGHPAEQIVAKLEVFDWLVEKQDKRVSTNPAGYLVDSIRKDYATPAGFEPAARRTEKKQADEQRQKKKAEDLAAKRRDEEQEHAARLAERTHIDNYLRGLTPQERRALEKQALANTGDKLHEAAQGGGPLGDVARRLLIDREVLRVSPLPISTPPAPSPARS